MQAGEHWSFAMGQPLPLHPDHAAPQAGHLLALAVIYEGASRTDAARVGTVTRQIVWHGVVRFNAAGPDGLIDRKPPGSPPRLTDAHRAALATTSEAGPIPASHGVVHWRTRPAAPQGQCTASMYLFGAVCPWGGQGAAVMLPFCNSAGMSVPLAEIAAMVEPGKHAVLLLDQAGW
jgi:hypothetical protein